MGKAGSKDGEGGAGASEGKGPILASCVDNLYTEVAEQNSPLLAQPGDTLDMILDFLLTKDLLDLCCTCKAMHSAVMAYLKHDCGGVGLQKAYAQFRQANRDLLTPREKRIAVYTQDILFDVSKSVEELTSRERRQLWCLAKEKDKFLTTRVSTTNDTRVDVTWRGTEHAYISVEQDEDLGREVCVLNNVCWLYLSTQFQDVSPGTYTCSLVLKVLRSCRMPLTGNEATQWIVDRADSTIRTGREFWDELILQKTPSAALCNGLTVEVLEDREYSAEESDQNSEKWIAIRTPAFRVTEQGPVVFTIRDTECRWWKSGIVFDFIELKKIKD